MYAVILRLMAKGWCTNLTGFAANSFKRNAAGKCVDNAIGNVCIDGAHWSCAWDLEDAADDRGGLGDRTCNRIVGARQCDGFLLFPILLVAEGDADDVGKVEVVWVLVGDFCFVEEEAEVLDTE